MDIEIHPVPTVYGVYTCTDIFDPFYDNIFDYLKTVKPYSSVFMDYYVSTSNEYLNVESKLACKILFFDREVYSEFILKFS